MEMNYLDENYFLDNSEHDLMLRARLLKNYIWDISQLILRLL